jgi:polyisoprenyl-phosphate glycosyltransferase
MQENQQRNGAEPHDGRDQDRLGRLSRPLISVVVPCFNEQDVLPLTHRRLLDTLGSSRDFDLEIVYVDDGSTDATSTLLDGIVQSDRRVVVVPFTRNFGHQAAVTAGLLQAAGDAVVVIDADLQDPPEVILTMIGKWQDGYEIVFGVRATRKEIWPKRLAYLLFYRLLRALADIDVPPDCGDFALIDREALDVLNSLPEHNRFVRGLRAWIGFRQIGVPYERPERAAGVTKYSWLKLLKLGFDGVFSFSVKPLSMVFWLGLTSSMVSALCFFAYLLWRLTGIEVLGRSPSDMPGFTTILLTLFLLSGIQLVSIGFIGEYVGRTYDETKNRPTFIARPARRLGASANTRAEREGQRRAQPKALIGTSSRGS